MDVKSHKSEEAWNSDMQVWDGAASERYPPLKFKDVPCSPQFSGIGFCVLVTSVLLPSCGTMGAESRTGKLALPF
jgi:hypothetical protein